VSEIGLVCSGCGHRPDPTDPLPFRCPSAGSGDDVDHVIARLIGTDPPRTDHGQDAQPFLRFREHLYPWHFARRSGMDDGTFVALVTELDARLAIAADGADHGITATPYLQSEELGRACGLATGGLWIKDETGNAGQSHKVRHLFGVGLQLLIAEQTGTGGPESSARLAVASCGNAALAAALVARALGRELDAFVPEDADPGILTRLEELGTTIHVCARRAGRAGDPCMDAYRAALGAGSLPFSCQGSENGLVIEGGLTLGFELLAAHQAEQGRTPDRIVVQVGGGALASSCVQACEEWLLTGRMDGWPRIHAVQTEGCHPLQRAWRRVAEEILAKSGNHQPPEQDQELAQRVGEAGVDAIQEGLGLAARNRSATMWPWETTPSSMASGILDDETYDWFAIVRGMLLSGGWPVIVSEADVRWARDRGRAATSVHVGATGAAGLAGLAVLGTRGALGEDEHIAVLFTGRDADGDRA